jgi:hypothetical protein
MMMSNTDLSNPARRVVLMVRGLHRFGYGRLRLVPGLAPSGMYWQGSVTHAGNTLKSHGAMAAQYNEDVASYMTGQGGHYSLIPTTHAAICLPLAPGCGGDRFLDAFALLSAAVA